MQDCVGPVVPPGPVGGGQPRVRRLPARVLLLPGLLEAVEEGGAMVVARRLDLREQAELGAGEVADRGEDVLVVRVRLQRLQVLVVGAEGQAALGKFLS